MLSQNQLVWVGGAAASTVAVVGAVAGALYWTHPAFLWPSPPAPQVLASAPEPKAASVPPAAPAVEPAAPAAAVSAPGGEAANEATVSPLKPAFDAVNVEPTGEAVIAGRAAPNAKVELRDDGKTVAEATADASGEFVIIPPALAPGDHSLSLAAGAGAAAPETSKVVAISVPQPEAKAASAATTLPRDRRRCARALPAARAGFADLGDAGAGSLPRRHPVGRGRRRRRPDRQGLGRAERDRAVLSQWLQRRRRQDAIGRPLVADDQERHDPRRLHDARRRDQPRRRVRGCERRYAVRLSGPRPRELRRRPPRPPPPQTRAPNAPPSADAVVDSVQTALVRPGHTLWALSQNYYGDPTRYPVIYEANKWEIHNPNLIYPGEVFVMPTFGPRP